MLGPRLLRADPMTDRIDVRLLDGDTAGQFVCLGLDEDGGPVRVQINDAISPGLRAAVARHLVADHMKECCTRSCASARAWLAEALPTLSPAEASLTA